MLIEPLGERHERATLSCGVEPLDRYFRTQARQDARRRVASCFLLVDDGNLVLGYYTLAATSIALTDLPAPLAKRLPRYPAVPAALLGRLAVDTRYRGRRLGEYLLLDAFARVLKTDIATHAIVVDAKDDTAAAFYGAYDFQPLTSSGRRPFIPVERVAKLFTD